MLNIVCTGTPYEIGYGHGKAARTQINRCIAFYSKIFQKNCNQTWSQVHQTAYSFDTSIKRNWPRYHQEMQGIAEGSNNSLLDIIALNVRTEIAFGQFTDGCTSLSWKTEKSSLLGQNWDWETEQKENLVLLTIHSPDYPTIKMVTEAGLIGKIGLNSSGVGICLNAIRAKGCDLSRLPVHLGLRMALECTSAGEAVQLLQAAGMAGAGHILIGDPAGAVGLEFTFKSFSRLEMDSHGRVYHSNHLLGEHPGADEPGWLADSSSRVARVRALAAKYDEMSRTPSLTDFARIFADEKGFPCGICRSEEGISDCATLFNIVMNLTDQWAVIRLGKPCQAEETIELGFGDI